MDYEKQEMMLPHNLPREAYLKGIKKLINTAGELGGTIYDVAVDSGLLSAERFMQLQLDEDIMQEPIFPANMTVVTEVYVEFGEDEPLDRIFLYSANAARDTELLREGAVRDRKLVIPYAKLSALHERGYKCIFGNAPDGRNGKAFARYNICFGADRRLEHYEMWNWFPYVGNGFNQGLMVRTTFDSILVMPDLHAVREAVKTFYAENLVRESVDADFRIERICMQDEQVLAVVRDGKADILGSSDREFYESLPDSYKRLIYQIAYIQTYYPKVYESVWDAAFEADDEKACVPFKSHSATLGISLGGQVCYGVCLMEDGSVKRVPNIKYPPETPLCQRYCFKGYGEIRNAGAAGSRMGLIIKDMIQSAETLLDVEIERVYVTHPDVLPDKDDIVLFMERRRKRLQGKGIAESDAGMIAYAQIEADEPDGEALIHWAMELAGVPEAVYVDALKAVVRAFEVAYGEVFHVDKPVLLYQFSQEKLTLTLLRKCASGEVELMEQMSECQPESAIYDMNDMDEDEYNPDLLMVFEQKLEKFMLKEGLSAIGINRESESPFDRGAFEELRSSAALIKRQFRRSDRVEVTFDNGFVTLKREYPIECLEECFRPILRKCEELLERLLERAGIDVEDISELLLMGEETQYPFVRRHMEELVKREARSLNTSECVEARGAALSDGTPG